MSRRAITLIFTLWCGALLAGPLFTEFPQMEPSGDLAFRKSQLGPDYLRFRYYGNEGAHHYRLLYAEYDASGAYLGFECTNPHQAGEFEFQFNNEHGYEICAAALDESDGILSVSPVETIRPGQMIEVPEAPRFFATSVAPQGGVTASDLMATIEIDPQQFPFVNVLTEVTLQGVPFDGDTNNLPLLDRNAFMVKEDSRLQNIRDLIPPRGQGGSKIADIVFVHDDSGSLGDEAAQVRANIAAFVNALAGANIDARLGLVPYGGGGGFSQPSGTLKNNGVLTANPADLIALIDQMRFDGGTERAFDALSLATQGSVWRPNTQRIIILITDEDNDTGSVNESQVTNLLINQGVTVYGLAAGHAEFNRIAAATGGKVFDIRSPFNTILDEIGAAIAAKYILQYETDNPVFDGMQRMVDLKVTVPDGNGGMLMKEVSGTYTPNPPIVITLTPETDMLSGRGNRQNAATPITAKITGGMMGSLSATLFYRNQNSSGFSSVSMSSLGNDLFRGTIPANAVVQPFVYYYIQASDGSQTRTLPGSDPANSPIALPILPNVAPVITHMPVTSAQSGQSIPINFTVEDTSNEIRTILFFYRATGSATYTQVNLTPGSTQTSATINTSIPGSVVGMNGVEYYIFADDDFMVSTTSGTADNPLTVFVSSNTQASGFMDIGNLRVFANSFTQQSGSPISQAGTATPNMIASGNVSFGLIGANAVCSFSGSLLLDYSLSKVTPVAEGTVTALNMRRNTNLPPENLTIFRGMFDIDCVPNPPVLRMISGTSLFRLIGNMTFLFPFANNTIVIFADKLEVNDISAQITSGINTLLQVGKITLSQTGASESKVTVNLGNLAFPVRNTGAKLDELSVTFDFLRPAITASAAFKLEGVIPGVGATLGFILNPFQLETLGGKLEFPPSVQMLLTVPPPTPMTPLGVSFTGASFLVDKISTGTQQLQLTAGGDAKLVDVLRILQAIETATGKKPISGGLALLVDFSGKVELSGVVKLFETFEVASAKLGIGNPTYLEGNLNLLNTITGRVYFSVGSRWNHFEITGQNNLTVQIPPQAPFIGGYVLNSQQVDATLRFNLNGIQKAEFRTKYTIFFADFQIRLDISDITDPNLFVSFNDSTIQVFEVADVNQNPIGAQGAAPLTVQINQATPVAIIRIVSDTGTPDFNITFPDGMTTFTPQMVGLDPNDPENTPGINNVFFQANAMAHEGYYAIQNPPQGTYTLSVNNAGELGNFTVSLQVPNTPPTIQIDSQTQDETWDGTNPVTINFTAMDPDSQATIDLYFDDDNTGHNGQGIIGNLVEGTDTSFDWVIDGTVQSGSYFIYAKIDDGINTPVYVYSQARVIVNNPMAPATPQNVMVTPGDGEITVTWDANSEQDLMGYRVLVSQTPGDGDFEFSFGAGLNTTFNLGSLMNGQNYEVAVQAVNATLLESLPSAGITVAPNGTGQGAFPDLTFDLANTTVIENGDNATVMARIVNQGENPSFSARVSVYYGGLLPESRAASQLIGGLDPMASTDLTLQFNINSVASDNSTVYVRIEEVVLPETVTVNNLAVFPTMLPFNPMGGGGGPGGNIAGVNVSVDQGSLTPTGSLNFNPQTGLFEVTLNVVNTNPSAVGGFRLYLGGLPANATVYNASGFDVASSRYFVLYESGLAAGQTVTFHIEVYDPLRRDTTGASLTLATELSGDTVSDPQGRVFSVRGFVALANGSILVEFNSVPGRTYVMQYSSDMMTWKTSPTSIVAAGNRVQWIDDGPPKTDTRPAMVTTRFYRVVEVNTVQP